MKRSKTTQSVAMKHVIRENRAREYLERLDIDFYQAFGKIYIDGRTYDDFQTAARTYDPEWYRRSI